MAGSYIFNRPSTADFTPKAAQSIQRQQLGISVFSTATIATDTLVVTSTATIASLTVTSAARVQSLAATSGITGSSGTITNTWATRTLAATSAVSGQTVAATSSLTGSSGGVTNTWTANTVAATSNVTGNHLSLTSAASGSSADFTNTVAANAVAATSGMTAGVGIGIGGTTAGAGGIAFPATAVAVANVNTLDDYEEGTWTPTLDFTTVGDLAVTYAIQVGSYVKIGKRVFCDFVLTTSAFTFTTASGNLQLQGFPFTAETVTNGAAFGTLSFQGITKATYTQIAPRIQSATAKCNFQASGSGVAVSAVTATDVPTGGTVFLRGSISYNAA